VAVSTAASSTATNAGNSQSQAVSFDDRRQAPTLAPPAVYASGVCTLGVSGGLSVPGGSISGGKSRVDLECERRETARLIMALNPRFALKMLCAAPSAVAVAVGDECLAYQAPQPLPPPVVVTVETDKVDESKFVKKEAVRRAIKEEKFRKYVEK
jgi:hypothetical protein